MIYGPFSVAPPGKELTMLLICFGRHTVSIKECVLCTELLFVVKVQLFFLLPFADAKRNKVKV